MLIPRQSADARRNLRRNLDVIDVKGLPLALCPVVGRITSMLGWAVTFLVVALVAALLGFGGVAGTAMEAAKLVFFVAIVLFAVSAVIGLMRGRSPTL